MKGMGTGQEGLPEGPGREGWAGAEEGGRWWVLALRQRSRWGEEEEAQHGHKETLGESQLQSRGESSPRGLVSPICLPMAPLCGIKYAQETLNNISQRASPRPVISKVL